MFIITYKNYIMFNGDDDEEENYLVEYIGL